MPGRPDRRGDLLGVALPRPDLARRRARADADHAEHGEADREAERRARPSSSRTSPNPDINIRYGTFYLRYLIDRFDDNEVAALAAYNAGETNVDRLGRLESLSSTTSASPRRADYVEDVLDKRDEYAQPLPSRARARLRTAGTEEEIELEALDNRNLLAALACACALTARRRAARRRRRGPARAFLDRRRRGRRSRPSGPTRWPSSARATCTAAGR